MESITNVTNVIPEKLQKTNDKLLVLYYLLSSTTYKLIANDVVDSMDI
jgi:hypothetical protein